MQCMIQAICKMCCAILAKVRIRVRLGFVSGLGSALSQKFANCTCTISNLHSTFCKLCTLTNHVHHMYMALQSSDAAEQTFQRHLKTFLFNCFD